MKVDLFPNSETYTAIVVDGRPVGSMVLGIFPDPLFVSIWNEMPPFVDNDTGRAFRMLADEDARFRHGAGWGASWGTGGGGR